MSPHVGVFTDEWPNERVDPGTAVYCPAFAGLPEHVAPWLSILPIHDANAKLLAAIAKPDFAATATRPGFAGLCLVDPFRKPERLFQSVLEAGIAGVANLPTVASFSGPILYGLEELSSGFDRELALLELAKSRGLRIAGVGADLEQAEKLRRIGCEFVVMLLPSAGM